MDVDDCLNSFNEGGSHRVVSKVDNSHMTELQKYHKIQQRTKLLYGVKDIKRMIEKSKLSR